MCIHCLHHTLTVHKHLHHFPAPSICITSLGLTNIWVHHSWPKNLCFNSLPSRIWLQTTPLSHDFLFFGHLILWACHFLPFVTQTPTFHILVLKVFSLLPVSEMTFLLLHMLKDRSYSLSEEKCMLWTDLCPLPSSNVEALTPQVFQYCRMWVWR